MVAHRVTKSYFIWNKRYAQDLGNNADELNC